jgi:lysophospholipase L1-like esterase
MLRRHLAPLAYVALALALAGCSKKEERPELTEGKVVRSAAQTIVVLGSSTAAGVGPSDESDAYLSRYRELLARRFPDFKLVNLAVPGQTTYQIQPTGFMPPASRPTPTAGKNISAALAFRPAAVLVNMPSNDAAANIPVAEQLANFARVARLAAEAHVLLWISSTQPRNFAPGQIAVQKAMRSAIMDQYSPRALDFWTPFASASGRILPEYDAGDGIHLNAAAHGQLLQIVLDAQIPEAVLAAPP